MLGSKIHDPENAESELGSIEGLGLLEYETVFKPIKTTTLSEGVERIFGSRVKGYEIHMGEAHISSVEGAFIDLKIRNGNSYHGTDGIVNENRSVFGTYMHGIFDSKEFTTSFINHIRSKKGLKAKEYEEVLDYWEFKEQQYDKLAEIVRNSLDMKKIYEILEDGIND